MLRSQAGESLRQAAMHWYETSGIRPTDLDELELFAQAVARQVGLVVAQAGVERLTGPRSSAGASIACGCGVRTKHKGYRPRRIATTAGEVRVRRVYYHCAGCGAGSAPWDEQQGLNGRLYSPRLKALVADLCARLPYAEAVRVLRLTTGIALEESAGEIIAAEVGGRVRATQTVQMTRCEQGEPIEPASESPDRLYIGMDGAMAHIDGAWHEVKAGVTYEGLAAEDGMDRCKATHYTAACESAEQFGSRLYALACQRGVERAGRWW